MNSVLVTGATGFIGSRLVRRLLDDGIEVVALVREGSMLPSLLQPPSPALHCVQDDGEIERLANVMAAHRTSLVVHCASHYVTTHSADDVVPLVQANVLLGTRLAEAMVIARVTPLIVLSTMWKHVGDTPSAYRPANLYAATKQALEDILLFYTDTADLTVCLLEIGDTYGPGDTRPKLIPGLLRALADHTAMDLSPGEQHLDLLHVDDVVNGILHAARSVPSWPAGTFDSFALSATKTVSLKELVKAFELAVNQPLVVQWGARPYRAREVMRPRSPHPPLPEWTPRIGLHDGLRSLARGPQR